MVGLKNSNSCFVLVFLFCLNFIPIYAQEVFQTFSKPSSSVNDILGGPQNRSRADTYYILGLSYARRGIPSEALAVIERGLRIERNNLNLLNLRAALWAREGRIRDAVLEFRRVLNIAPNNSYAQNSLNSLYKTLKGNPKSVFPGNSGLVKPMVSPVAPVSEPNSHSASSTKVLESTYFFQVKSKRACYYSMSEIKRAQEAFKKSNPGAENTSSTIDGAALISAKLLPSMPICPDSGEYTWKAAAPMCSKHGDFSTVESEVNTVFKDFNRGLQAKLGRNFPEAQKAFDQVVILYPRWAEAYFQLGDTFFRGGDDAKAIETLRTCMKVDPTHLDAKLLLANLYYKTGHKDSALTLLDSVVNKVPDSVYGLSARSIAASIRSGKNYYQIFPPY